MKANIYLVVALITMGFLSKSNEAEAYTVAVGCSQNPVPPPTIPFHNAICRITWTADGSVFTNGIKSEAAVQWWSSGGEPVIKDVKATAIRWAPGSEVGWAPDPDRWVIGCSDLSGSFRLYGYGFVYRRYYYTGGDYIYQQWALESDAVFTYIYEPSNVPCS
jgi:hypothetical protein